MSHLRAGEGAPKGDQPVLGDGEDLFAFHPTGIAQTILRVGFKPHMGGDWEAFGAEGENDGVWIARVAVGRIGLDDQRGSQPKLFGPPAG